MSRARVRLVPAGILFVLVATQNPPLRSQAAQGPAPRDAVTGGTVTSDYPAVAALVFPSYLCSGVLVSSSCLLTAAHCVEKGVPPGSTAFFGSDLSQPALAHVNLTGDYELHPAHDGDYDHDIALVSLVSDPGIAPLETAAFPTTDTVRIVGWGDDESAVSGIKRQADLAIVDPTGGATLGQASGYPSGCSGDSGGPILDQESAEGPWRAVGVTTAGSASCDSYTLGAIISENASLLDFLAEAACNAAFVGDGIYLHGFEDGFGKWLVEPNPNSCSGRCDVFDEAYPCQCDSDCLKFGDCCADACSLCGHC
jgi:secreted trypsin-like serine protease